jgi:thiamine-monophosphate kinase
MSRGEFELIERYFTGLGARRPDVVLGVGDDAALLRPPPGCELVATTDTLVSGRHFLASIPPQSLGHRSLAVNLSDIAAMGAEPAWALLSLTLPAVDEGWLAEFAAGFAALASAHAVALIGGNLSRGPLAITVQLLGLAPAGAALRRYGARPGDSVFVTGTLGDAAAGLLVERGELAAAGADAASLIERYRRPTPRIAAGQLLRATASACIDISDGLYADVGKLAAASGCGVLLDVARLPLSAALLAAGGQRAQRLALAGGDDYELCFTVRPERVAALVSSWPAALCAVSCIGTATAERGVALANGTAADGAALQGYDHFRSH